MFFPEVDRTPNKAASLGCGSVWISHMLRFFLGSVWGLVNHLVVCEWWMKNEMVRDCWIPVKRTRSKKTVNKGAKSTKALAQ